MTNPNNTPPHTYQQVINEWQRTQPAPNLIQYHMTPRARYHGNFTLSYEVRLQDWRYVVQAHAHNTGHTNVSGNTWVCGFEGQEIRTPQFALGQAPAYSAQVHPTQPGPPYASDTGYADTLFGGNYRSPTRLS